MLIHFKKNYLLSILFLSFSLFFSTTSWAKNWYEGGTLNDSNAISWQRADYDNKLASCADLIATLYNKELLAPKVRRKIRKIDDFKPYAEQLVKQLDEAFKPEPDIKKNERMYSNQGVASSALMIMLMNDWVKK